MKQPQPKPMRGAFFICRPMTIKEWMALDPKQRGSTEDMTADEPKESKP